METKYLASAIKRARTLRELRESGPMRQSEIREELNVSKSTAHRKVKKLRKMGLAHRTDEGYDLTDLGVLISYECCEMVSRVSEAREFEDFVDIFLRSDLSIEDVRGADVTKMSRSNPMAPLMRLADVTDDSEEVRVLTNSVAPESFEVGREGIRNGEKDVEMVVDRRTMDSIEGSEWLGEELARDLGTGNLRIWIHEEPVPYQIGIMDERLCLGAEDDERMPVAMLETEDEGAVDWARGVFEEYRARAERLEASEVTAR